jgi:NAD(P)-dependent dehydrogenase (short-subunit alcohol dehydrogenase family)
MELDGRSAVVTGAGSGVGRASALRFAEEGARVLCADIDQGRAEETAALITKAGGTAAAFRADVSVEPDVIAMLDAAAERFGRLDVLFNNVGVPTPRLGAKLEDHTVQDFDRLVSINLRGVFLGCKHAVVRFKQQSGQPAEHGRTGGVILNTGSVAGLVGWGGTVYGATKGGVHQLTRTVAVECAPFGIRVNAICPAGMPYTNFMAAGGMGGGPEAMEQAATQVGASHPLGRPITAEDCAEAAVYLVSDRAANVTGVLLPVDGGYVAR